MYLACIEECGWVKHTDDEEDEDLLGCPECMSGVLMYTDYYWQEHILAPHGAHGMVIGGADNDLTFVSKEREHPAEIVNRPARHEWLGDTALPENTTTRL